MYLRRLDLFQVHSYPPLIMQKLSSTQILCILNLLDSGLSLQQISIQTCHGISTISHTHSEHQLELQKSSGGHPTKLSTTNVKYARQIIRMGKVDNATEAAKTLQDITNTPFSSQTLHQHLKSRGMRPVVKRKCLSPPTSMIGVCRAACRVDT